MERIEKLKSFILSWEGSFVNDPRDLGGATNKGITADQRQTIFKKYYWDRYKADQIKDDYVAFLLVDWLWGSGKYAVVETKRIFY